MPVVETLRNLIHPHIDQSFDAEETRKLRAKETFKASGARALLYGYAKQLGEDDPLTTIRFGWMEGEYYVGTLRWRPQRVIEEDSRAPQKGLFSRGLQIRADKENVSVHFLRNFGISTWMSVIKDRRLRRLPDTPLTLEEQIDYVIDSHHAAVGYQQHGLSIETVNAQNISGTFR